MPLTEHTPGPWELRDLHDGGLALVEAQHLRITVDHRENFGRAKPDAYLIAAAPELLEACKTAYNGLKSYAYGNASPDLAREAAEFIRKAIDKAEGRDHAPY